MQDNNKEEDKPILNEVLKSELKEDEPIPPPMKKNSEPKEEKPKEEEEPKEEKPKEEKPKEKPKEEEPKETPKEEKAKEEKPKKKKEEDLLKSIKKSIIKNEEQNSKNFKKKSLDSSDALSEDSFLAENKVIYDETTNKQFYKENKRTIKISIPKKVYGSNSVIFRKYTALNFLIINLFEQFSKPVNIYFIFLSILQFIPRISISNENPTILIPLFFILIFHMVKDLLEDLRINKLDKRENLKKIEIIRQKTEKIKWEDLFPGEVIVIKENESVPADCLFLYSSNVRDDCCYVDCSNINGQSNYEKKNTVLEIDNFADESPVDYIKGLYSREVEFEKENKNFYSFKGTFGKEDGEKVSLKIDNLLLRGSVLRNTDYVYCVVLYTGSLRAKYKQSKLDGLVSKYVLYAAVAQLFLSVFASIYHILYLKSHENSFGDVVDFDNLPMLLLFIGKLKSNFVPISLLLSLELVKYYQASNIQKDKFFFTKVKDELGLETGQLLRTVVNNSALNEDLGQITHIFSDKTGTLTKNKIEFNRIIIGPYIFCKKENNTENNPFGIKKNKIDKNLVKLRNTNNDEGEICRNALRCLSLCHSSFFDDNNNINSTNPEDECILDFCYKYNYKFMKPEKNIDNELFLELKEKGISKKYKKLHHFPFTSKRKRESIVVEYADDVFIFMKGADDIIEDYLQKDGIKYIDDINDEIDIASNDGLRVLSLAMKRIDRDEWEEWRDDFSNVQDKRRKLEMVEEIESEMILLGAAVLESKLQDGIIDDVKFILDTGINFWILSGDKIDPLFSVGQSLKLITEETELVYFDDLEKTSETHLNDTLKRLEGIPKTKSLVAIINGPYYSTIQNYQKTNPLLFQKFTEIILNFKFALFGRLSPNQKGSIVKLIREANPESRCLAIGDGSNDVNMLSTAHVGVGIEGFRRKLNHTSKAADIKIPEFNVLIRLMYYFGRESYRKNANLVLYNFYKSILITFPQFWFGFFNNFAGQTLYHPYLYQLYNILFTFLPIILFAIYDKMYPKKKFLFSNLLYKTGMDNFYFNTKRFLITMSLAFLLSLNLVLVTLSFFDWGNYKDGAFYGFWNFGNMVFLSVVIIVNLKILFISNSFSFLSVLSVIVSIFLFIFLWFIVSAVEADDLYKSFKEITENHHFYLFLIVVFGISVYEYLITMIDYSIYDFIYVPKIQVDFHQIGKKKGEDTERKALLDGDGFQDLGGEKKVSLLLDDSHIENSYFEDKIIKEEK